MSYRVIQWGTGTLGRHALARVLEHPDLELAGVVVYTPEKDGVDAGELCGAPPVGVRATIDRQAALDIDADCVLYMALGGDPEVTRDEICRILESGKSVVSTAGGYIMYPKAMGADLRERFEAACRKGGSTLHGTGLSPGLAHDLLPLALSGLSRRIDRVLMEEWVNMAHYASRDTMHLIGWGRRPDELETPDGFFWRLVSSYKAPLQMTVEGLGGELEDFRMERHLVTTPEAFEVGGSVIERGTVSGMRFVFSGIVGGRPAVVIDTSWRLHDEHGAGDDWIRTQGEGWALTLEGEPRVCLEWEIGPKEGVLSRSPYRVLAGSMHAVNSVPAVCEAPPGIATFLDLPLVRGGAALA